MTGIHREYQREQANLGAEQQDNPFRPPSKEEIKRELLSKPYRQIDYDREYQRNRKAAIKELLEESVQDTTKVNEEINSKFEEGKGGS